MNRAVKVSVCVFIGSEELERDVEFEVVGEAPDKAPPPQTNQEEVNSITNGNKDSAQPSTSSKGQQEILLFFFHITSFFCTCVGSFYCESLNFDLQHLFKLLKTLNCS